MDSAHKHIQTQSLEFSIPFSQGSIGRKESDQAKNENNSIHGGDGVS